MLQLYTAADAGLWLNRLKKKQKLCDNYFYDICVTDM